MRTVRCSYRLGEGGGESAHGGVSLGMGCLPGGGDLPRDVSAWGDVHTSPDPEVETFPL